MNKVSKAVTIIGAVVSTLGAAWWYLFYSEAVKAFESGTMSDVLKCLYSNDEECAIVNRSAALLGDTAPYNPVLFLSGLGVLVLGLVLTAVLKKA